MDKHIKYLLQESVEALREAGEWDDNGHDGYISLAIEIEESLATPTKVEKKPITKRMAIAMILETAREEYHQKILAIAKTEYERYVVPFCEKRGWHFRVRLGNWYIGPPGEKPCFLREHQEDEEWREIEDILARHIKGINCNDFGALMPDYMPEKFLIRLEKPNNGT